MRNFFTYLKQHERHVSAGAMIVGFVVDNIFFGRVDQALTHIVFISYLVIAAVSIAWVHRLEATQTDETQSRRLRTVLPVVTQFAFGGMWSGFLIFYARSATLSASWPFLLVLGGIFLGNEIFREYHDRLVFNVTLYFFALYSYAIFAVPVITKDIGTGTFLLSGVVAVIVFAGFMIFLRRIGRERLVANIWQVRFYVSLVLVAMNLFYFTNLLPPLPLALSSAGIYHDVERVGNGYQALTEQQPWYVESLGLRPTLHVLADEKLTAFSAVFAPVDLNTTITDRWEWYDQKAGSWVTESAIVFPIAGGREQGYRGYTRRGSLQNGPWRVDIETADGRVIGRIRFKVEQVTTPAETQTITL